MWVSVGGEGCKQAFMMCDVFVESWSQFNLKFFAVVDGVAMRGGASPPCVVTGPRAVVQVVRVQWHLGRLCGSDVHV